MKPSTQHSVLSTKRLLIATTTAAACGLIDWQIDAFFARMSGYPIAPALAVSIVFGRTLIGPVIAISSLRFPWWAHGLLIGAVVSLPAAASAFIFGSVFGAIWFTKGVIAGAFYGLLAELVTSVFFGATASGEWII